MVSKLPIQFFFLLFLDVLYLQYSLFFINISYEFGILITKGTMGCSLVPYLNFFSNNSVNFVFLEAIVLDLYYSYER